MVLDGNVDAVHALLLLNMHSCLVDLLRLLVDGIDKAVDSATFVLESLREPLEHANHWLHELREANIAMQLSVDNESHDASNLVLDFGLLQQVLVVSVDVVVLEAAEVEWESFKSSMLAISDEVYQHIKSLLLEQ